MIGAGSISRSHLSALAARDDVEIAGIADLNEAAAREQAARFGIRGVFTDYRELIEREDVDAVVIGIPTHFHAEAAVAALRGVTASIRGFGRIGDIDDMGTVIVDFQSGDQMLCQWSYSLPPGALASIGGLDVIGPDGAIREPRREADGHGVVVVSKANGQEERHSYPTELTPENWFGGQIANFIAAIRGEEPPRATIEDGRKAQEIYLAAVESSRAGRRVELPL